MEVQAALGSDIALAFDECTPFHVDRDYTARSTERTHRWLERCLRWHDEHGPRRPARLRDRPGRRPRGPAARLGARGRRRAAATGIAIGGSLGADKAQMYEVVELGDRRAGASAPERPRHLLGIGDVDDLDRAASSWASTRSTARCRRGWAATAWRSCPSPEQRWRVDLTEGAAEARARADHGGLPVPGLRGRLLARLPALPAPARAS